MIYVWEELESDSDDELDVSDAKVKEATDESSIAKIINDVCSISLPAKTKISEIEKEISKISAYHNFDLHFNHRRLDYALGLCDLTEINSLEIVDGYLYK